MALFSPEMIILTERLLIAAVLCGLVGVEREFKRHPAGFRTHLLVGVGSCLMMLLSVFGFEAYLSAHPQIQGFDPSRLPAYVVSGIGFLGAGTILVQGVTVRGLTTAASIWVVAGIGLVVGIGMYYAAIFTTFILIISLLFLNKFEDLYLRKIKHHELTVVVRSKSVSLSAIIKLVESYEIKVKRITIEDYPEEVNREPHVQYNMYLDHVSDQKFIDINDKLNSMEEIYKVFTTE